jgi:DNA-binding CsgD family transcriptional regulator
MKLSPALTTRERKVLQLVLEGESNFDIGSRLKIKLSTVESDLQNMVGKLGANINRDVIRHAVERRGSPKRPRTPSKKLIN